MNDVKQNSTCSMNYILCINNKIMAEVTRVRKNIKEQD